MRNDEEADVFVIYPKMILFDYGHTLLYEPGWDTMHGNIALLKYATKNSGNYTAADVAKQVERLLDAPLEEVRNLGYDITGQAFQRTLYASLGIELSLSPLEMEIAFWDAASSGASMPDADRMIDYMNKNGIRSGVISNLIWSGDALSARLNRMLPHNKFEFVITSSDYLFRKPSRHLFELALRKTGLSASDVWYCGDNPVADVTGAAHAGIFPVWYDNATGRDADYTANRPEPKNDHLYIHEWNEMISILDELKE